MSTIRIENYTASYLTDADEGHPVLVDINLEIRSGETVLITGGSGCGKTTLLRSINGLIPGFIEAKTSGSIRVGNRLIEEMEARDIASVVGMVFQDPRAEFFTHDVISELAFPCENFNTPSDEIAARVEAVADELSIRSLLGRRWGQLSSGEKQKVTIAAAMMLRPSVLLFDEPSANLDQDGLHSLADAIRKLKDSGHTVVIADHRLNYLAEVIDRCIVLKDGHLIEDVPLAELSTLPAKWFSDRGLRQIAADQECSSPKRTHLMADGGPRLTELTYAYPRHQTLWSVRDVQFPRQGVIGLTGSNGCGKTTLLKVIMGVLRAKSGDIRLSGRPWRTRQRRRDCAYVMQDVDYQLSGETVWDEMFVGVKTDRETEQRALELLERMELLGLRDRHPLTLSGGQKQRLAIALACIKQSAVICLDEPTSGLDANNMLRVAGLLNQLAEDGALIILITHDREFARITLDAEVAIANRFAAFRPIHSPQMSR